VPPGIHSKFNSVPPTESRSKALRELVDENNKTQFVPKKPEPRTLGRPKTKFDDINQRMYEIEVMVKQNKHDCDNSFEKSAAQTVQHKEYIEV